MTREEKILLRLKRFCIKNHIDFNHEYRYESGLQFYIHSIKIQDSRFNIYFDLDEDYSSGPEYVLNITSENVLTENNLLIIMTLINQISIHGIELNIDPKIYRNDLK